jgi:hypothetical protein
LKNSSNLLLLFLFSILKEEIIYYLKGEKEEEGER